MFKNIGITILGCLFHIASPVYAYEFTQVDTLFDSLLTDYNGLLNFKNLSLQSGEALNKIDESLKLYNSDSKAFLYDNNNLVATFKFPQGENPQQWKQLLSDILKTGTQYSSKLSDNPKALETEVLTQIMKNLDKYSRIEKANLSDNKIFYRFIDNILYLQPKIFYSGLSDYFRNIVASHPTNEGIVLDLRNNHGGDFNEAIKTVDLFLDNALITYRESAKQPKHYYTSTEGDILDGKPLIILTNEETASSAEIVAAALSEQSRAILIGTKTYGKDSTQLVHYIGEKKVYITNGYFYTPSGKRISETGVSPKICTGIANSCTHSDKNNPNKDILIAINLIKKDLG